mgnify:CR=1 FL=1
MYLIFLDYKSIHQRKYRLQILDFQWLKSLDRRESMSKQILIVLGIMLVFGCADVSKENQLQTGCSESSESTPENVYVSPAPSTPDTTAPTISSASPSNGATNISVSSDITITFSESMDSSTINTANIGVADSNGNIVSGVVSYNSNVATFNPSGNLSYSKSYTISVSAGVKDSAGNALGSSSSWPQCCKDLGPPFMTVHWNFTTSSAPADTTAPTISSVSPSNGATNISVSSNIRIYFNELMNCSTINTSNITITDNSGNSVSGVVICSAAISRDDILIIIAIFNPSNDLDPNATYTVTAGTGVKDNAGNALEASYSWNFSTN